MKMVKIAIGVAVVGLFLGLSSEASAQRPAHYRPIRPPFSRYFGYSAFNTTGIPNYYLYVRPAQQYDALQYQTFLEHERPETFEAAGSRTTLDENRVRDIFDRQLELRGTTGVGAPAQAASYQNYSHFYPKVNLPARR